MSLHSIYTLAIALSNRTWSCGKDLKEKRQGMFPRAQVMLFPFSLMLGSRSQQRRKSAIPASPPCISSTLLTFYKALQRESQPQTPRLIMSSFIQGLTLLLRRITVNEIIWVCSQNNQCVPKPWASSAHTPAKQDFWQPIIALSNSSSQYLYDLYQIFEFILKTHKRLAVKSVVPPILICVKSCSENSNERSGPA